MKLQYNQILTVFIASLGLLLLTQCTPVDHFYSEYLADGERIYPGRIDSIQFQPGNRRAGIRAKISTDARVVKMRVSWGQGNSFEIPVLPNEIAQYKDVVIPEVAEGSYTFDIRTFDSEGNQSMRSEIFGRVYGQSYINNLNNRIVNNLERRPNDEMVLNWFVETPDTTLLGTILRYPNLAGDSVELFVASNSNQTSLPGIDITGTFNYRNLYKPNSLAIDTFYAHPVTLRTRELLPPDRELYAYTNWSIAGFSSEEPNNSRLAARLIDGRDDTFWIARFSNNATSYPNHWVTIDMGEPLFVNGFMFAQKNGDRKIRDMEVQVSNDNQNWSVATLIRLVAVDRTKQYFDLPEPLTFRYFKIVPIDGHDAQQQPGLALAGTFRNVFTN